MGTLAGGESGPRLQGALRIDNRVTESRQVAAQPATEKPFVPMAVPHHAGRATHRFEPEAHREDGTAQQWPARPRRDEGGLDSLVCQICPEASHVCVNAGTAVLAQDRGDDQGLTVVSHARDAKRDGAFLPFVPPSWDKSERVPLLIHDPLCIGSGVACS